VLQRTFYPKHTTYWGDGSGRDNHVLQMNGGLNRLEKKHLGHGGFHFQKYNSNAQGRSSPTPRKEATTFYY